MSSVEWEEPLTNNTKQSSVLQVTARGDILRIISTTHPPQSSVLQVTARRGDILRIISTMHPPQSNPFKSRVNVSIAYSLFTHSHEDRQFLSKVSILPLSAPPWL